MRFLRLAALLVLLAAPAHASPQITVTACDTISTSPLLVKTTFTVDIPGAPGPWYEMIVQAQAATGTQVLACGGAPADWVCEWSANAYTVPTAHFEKPGGRFETNDHLEGFAIVSNRAAPCVGIVFFGPLLFKGSERTNGLDGSYGILGCLMKDGPVPAAGTSWGRLKSRYR